MRDLTIFAANFKPDRGGVAEYTYQLAHGLYSVGRLGSVVTTVPQKPTSEYQFDVVKMNEKRKLNKRWGDSVLLFRKFNSLIHLSKKGFLIHRTVLNLLRGWWDQHILITSVYRSEAKSVVSACMKLQIDFSIVFHGRDFLLLEEQNPPFLDRICDHAEILVFNSEATRELFCRVQSPPSGQSYILYPGINPSQLESAQSTPVYALERRYDVDFQEKTIILSLARLVKRKGIDIALRALTPILDSSEQYHYIIAGDGPEYDALKSGVEARGLGEKVTLTGEVTDAEKYGLLESSTIFVMPNHTQGGNDFEGFGISFIEASYFENVVIGGRSGGAEEAISGEKSGYLLDVEEEGAEKELRALMRRLLADPNHTEELARRGRNYVLEHFQAPELVARFARSFDDIVES